MKLKSNYLINGKTILLYGVYYERGELYTFVIEGDDSFLVAMPPEKLIDESLKQYGSDLKGALHSSKELLGENRKMYPIKMNGSLDIWLFPTKSYKKRDCVWFVLNHIHDTKPKGLKRTIIILSNGHTFEMEMKESAFREKRSNTEDLRNKITSNMKSSDSFMVKSKKGITIVEEKGEYKFKGKRKESHHKIVGK